MPPWFDRADYFVRGGLPVAAFTRTFSTLPLGVRLSSSRTQKAERAPRLSPHMTVAMNSITVAPRAMVLYVGTSALTRVIPDSRIQRYNVANGRASTCASVLYHLQ